MMNITDVAPELEDGFEEESTSDTFVKTQSGGLFPARWTPTARAPIRGVKKTIPRGSLTKLLLPQRQFEGIVYPTKGTRSIHHPGQVDRVKVGGRNRQDPKLTGNTPWERWRDARLRCRVRKHSVLAGATPLEKWKDARLRCSDQRRFQGLRSERAELWPETDSVYEFSLGLSQSMRHPTIPNYPPPAPPDTTTTTTSSSPTRSSPTPSTQPDATTSKARTNSPPTTEQFLQPTTPAIPELTDSAGQFSQAHGSPTNNNTATLPTRERLQIEQLHRQQRLEGCLRFRDMITEQGLFERDIDERCLDDSDSGGINPWRARLDHVVPAVPVAPCARVPNLSDSSTNPYVGSTEAGEIFRQVASGDDPDMINVAWAPDPNSLPRPWRPDHQRKYKTRWVFHGDSVLTEDEDTALLQDIQATLEASYVNNLYGYRASPGLDYVPLISTSFRTQSIRNFAQRVELRRRLWKGLWALRTGPSHDE
jgi:hypothetical protein